MAKKTNKRKPAKTGRKSKYEARFAAVVSGFVDCPQSLMVRGKLSDTKLGTMFGVDRRTIRRWRIPTDGHLTEFQPTFAAACTACQNAIDAGAVKRSMVEKATGFVQRKVIRQRNEDGQMKIVRDEKITQSGDVAAAKLVLENIQKADDPEAWDVGEKIDASVTVSPLKQLIDEIGQQKPGLPSEE